MPTNTLHISRELRFGLSDQFDNTGPGTANNFAGSPALTYLAPFLTLAATLRGNIDPQTGMLINIKIVDRILRQLAVPLIRNYYNAPPNSHTPTPLGCGDLLLDLYQKLAHQFHPYTLAELHLSLSPYLRLFLLSTEPHMVHLAERFEFSAAHRLHSSALTPQQNIDVFGRCNNPSGHGHNYILEVTLSAEPDSITGIVFPIHQLQKIVNTHIIDVFDHKHLNIDCPEFQTLNPTVENIAQVIFEKLRPHFPPAQSSAQLTSLKVWETPKTCAEVRAG